MRNRNRISDTAFVELVREILPADGRFGWELGPGYKNHEIDVLAISPGGNPSLLNELINKHIIQWSEDNWSIVVGIPPKEWEMRFLVIDHGHTVEIDGSKWMWYADKSDLLWDLRFYHSGELSQEVAQEAGIILLTGELGELNRINFIDNFLVTSQPPPKEALPISLLRPKFVEEFPDCDYFIE